jgi:hypothetical protein
MDDGKLIKRKCPNHPSAGVIPARKPGDERLQWICLQCGQRLGDAGPRSVDRETFVIGVDEKNSIDTL